MLNRGEYNGHRFLAPKTIDMMLKNQIGDAKVWDREDNFGLGFQLITEGSHYGDQARPGAYTWGGLFCSEYTIDPEEELVMLVYTNVAPFPLICYLGNMKRICPECGEEYSGRANTAAAPIKSIARPPAALPTTTARMRKN